MGRLSGFAADVRARLDAPRASEGGVTAVEYALMVAIIALLLVGGFYLLFNSVASKFDATADCVDAPAGAACPTGSDPGGN
jgi:Flp pilus assembly pilin Flp